MAAGRLADKLTGTSNNAWLFWKVEQEGSLVPVSALRDRLLTASELAWPSDVTPKSSGESEAIGG